jgi:hypothetical protein
MGSKRVPFSVICLLFSGATVFSLLAQDLDRLPIKRVVLYKNGVGYFEHLGPVKDRQDVSISFTSGQLNDVLKSLTVLDLDGGRITGVGYGSTAPADRQLGDLRLPVGEKTTLTELLGALRGAKLEVRSATGVITGRLLSVERKTRMGGGATLEVDYVSLLTEGGEVKTTEVSPSFSVKLLDRGLAGKVDRYLDVAGAAREADVRRMVISTDGTGSRNLFVSYISEVPVWKATYRIVLDSKRSSKPLLQGWAIVDNTVGQDWERVELSLVAGAPQSFIQNLSQPFYARRPVVEMRGALNGSPQTYESTLITGPMRLAGVVSDPSGAVIEGARVKAYDSRNVLAGETTSDSRGAYGFADLPDGNYRLEVAQGGFQRGVVSNVGVAGTNAATRDVVLNVGSSATTVEVQARDANNLNTETASVSGGRNLGSGRALGNSSEFKRAESFAKLSPGVAGGVGQALGRSESAATAQELGDLFEYKLREPITIEKNRSALVPIVQASIGAEKVSVWNEQSGLPRPQRALWITNSSGLTLDGGTFSVLEEETFAGEGIFDSIRPDEKRLVSYATDLALTVNAHSASERERVSRVKALHGVITLQSEIREKKTYMFRNEDTAARAVIVEHPVRPGFELRGESKPVETTPGWMRFRVSAGSKQTVSLVVEEARPVESAFQLTNITDEQVGVWVREKSINPAVEVSLRRILTAKAAIEELDEKKTAREEEASKIFDDQQRLRENMKALKGSPEERTLLQRYTRQLNEQEDRLAALKTEVEQLTAQVDKAQAGLDQMIVELAFDDKM